MRCLALGPFLLVACVGCVEEEGHPELATEEVGTARSAVTVGQAVNGGCSTAAVDGLSRQIIAKGNCIEPGAFVEVPDLPNITFGSNVYPFLEQPARDAFVATANANPGMTMTVNSMLRTVAQQVLLYRWDQNGQCGIEIAAYPGNSNHETGLAFDTSQYAAWRNTLEAHGFSWYGTGDDVHFDYTGPGAVSYKGLDVLAFQMLWNEHHPEDPIDEDGIYGPQTEARLLASPAEGFPSEVVCDEPAPDRPDVYLSVAYESAQDTFLDGPSAGVVDLFEGDDETWFVHLDNRGLGAATDVIVTVEADATSFELDDYAIEQGASMEGPFTTDPADGAAPNPKHGALLGARFDLHLGPLAAGEHKRIALQVIPIRYSVDTADPQSAPALRTWVSKVDELYAQSEFGAEVTNVDGAMTSPGGRLEALQTADIYSRTRWEWDGQRLEGASASAGATFMLTATTLDLVSGGDGAYLTPPPFALTTGAQGALQLRASRSGGAGDAAVLVSRDSTELDEADVMLVDLPADGAMHDVTVPLGAGALRRIAFVPFTSTAGRASLDALRVEGVISSSGDDDGEGGAGAAGGGSGEDGPEVEASCDCRAAPSSPSGSAPLWAAALLGAALLRVAHRRRGQQRRG